jgi:hypothetical protein
LAGAILFTFPRRAMQPGDIERIRAILARDLPTITDA